MPPLVTLDLIVWHFTKENGTTDIRSIIDIAYCWHVKQKTESVEWIENRIFWLNQRISGMERPISKFQKAC
jgi:hypothetical protein